MTSYPLIGPDGKTYPIEADSLENAHKALDWHLANPNTGEVISRQYTDPNTGQTIIRNPGATSTPFTDLAYGTREPIDNLRILAARAYTGIAGDQEALSSTYDRRDAARRAYEAAHAGGPPDDSSMKRAGENVLPLATSVLTPGATAARFIPRAASNAFSGGVDALMAGDPNAPPSQIAGNVLTGAGIGVGSAVGPSVWEPRMSMPGSDVRKLMDLGVRPTPGQLGGSIFDRFEQALGNSIPFVGDMIKGARRRAASVDLDRGVINDALSHIGKTLPSDTEVGRPALNFMADEASGAYTRAVPQAGAALDATAQAELAALRARMAAHPNGSQFDNELNLAIDKRLNAGPWGSHLSGEGFKDAESQLGRTANKFIYSSDAWQQLYGEALQDAQTTLRDNLARAHPSIAEDIKAANQTWAKLKVIQRATRRPSMEPGVFGPAKLQEAADNETRSEMARMRGTGLYQPEAAAARRVLGADIPNSGTPYQLAAQLAATGGVLGGGAYFDQLDQDTVTKAALGAGALGAAYNPVTQPLLAHLLASRYPWMRALTPAVRAATPAVTAGTVTGLLGEP